MQSSNPPQRPSQRRQGLDSSQSQRPPTDPVPTHSISQSQDRSTSGPARSHGSRTSNPDKQISQIEKSVTHLLVATKQLLETLTQWSRGNAQEEEVSDVYVRLGYEFNLACRAFNSIGVETLDLGPVPDLLRSILEDTLSQPASPQALDNYLPRIRDIIINLLQGLKKKQSKLRSRPKDGQSSRTPTPARQASVASTGSNETTLTSMMENVPLPSQTSKTQNEGQREASLTGTQDVQQDWTPANSSASTIFDRNAANRRSLKRDGPALPAIETSSPPLNSAIQNLPVLSPSTNARTIAQSDTSFLQPPPPPPKQDALTALQRGGDLERRASRRFSAYQIQKHLGASPNGVPIISAAQTSPIPNRGRELRESMRAVTSRTSYQQARQKSVSGKHNDTSPNGAGAVRAPEVISEEPEEVPNLSSQPIPKISPPIEEIDDSPTAKTPEEFRSRKTFTPASPGPQMTATVNGPLSPSADLQSQTSLLKEQIKQESPDLKVDETPKAAQDAVSTHVRSVTTPEPSQAVDQDDSPSQLKELTLFLQYKSRIKKFVLPGGYEELTLARLQLAFIEKFAWNTHNNGVDLPEIYIQDPVSGVRHELEDLSDVKDRSVLALNVEILDEVKKHFDDGIGGLRTTLEGVRTLLDGQGTMMQRFSDRQLQATKDMARLSAVPLPRTPRNLPPLSAAGSNTASLSESSMTEVQNLRRDIAVLRQSYSAMSADFAAAMSDIKVKAVTVKEAAAAAVVPSYEGNAGRAHVNEGKKGLQADSESLVNRVDDLADIVEDLRKDVVTRGVRPRPLQLEQISKEISTTAKDLAKMKDFMKREKPVWTKIWEQELNLVCTERDDLTQQEELMADLHGDLEDVQNVFNLVEEAMKQQHLQNGGVRFKGSSKTLEIDPSVDPSAAKEGVLDDVRALKPNHENRLEAIERAEKARQKELLTRKANEFQREVETFVEEGKLKKTGGADEVERLRKLKEERARKENWEWQKTREIELDKKRAERAAAKAARTAAATSSQEVPVPEPEPVHTEAYNEAPAEAGTQNAEQDVSLEGEGVFQDAPTGNTPQHTPSLEAAEPTTVSSPPPPPPPKDGDSESERRIEDAPPQLPELVTSIRKPSDAGSSQAGDRSSWWKPAVF